MSSSVMEFSRPGVYLGVYPFVPLGLGLGFEFSFCLTHWLGFVHNCKRIQEPRPVRRDTWIIPINPTDRLGENVTLVRSFEGLTESWRAVA
jgi:hypothetical protein